MLAHGTPALWYEAPAVLPLSTSMRSMQKVDAPVLVIRRGADDVMSRGDSEAIAQIVNQAHPGRARYLENDGMGHGFTKGRFCDALVPTALAWMKQQQLQ